MTNTVLFREMVDRSGLKYKRLAQALGITPYGLQKKIENHTEFKASEIVILSDLLHLSEKDRNAIFFCHEK